MSFEDIYNAIQISPQLLTAGQPTAEQLRALAQAGFVNVINLATYHAGHSLEDEAGLARSLGLSYFHIPVEWGNPLESDFAAFEQVLAGLPAGPTLLHCAANFRATAFYSLYAQKHLGWAPEQAEVLRAQIWAGSDYPAWTTFLAHMQARLAGA